MSKKIISILLILMILISTTTVLYADDLSTLREKKTEAQNEKKEVQENKSEAMKQIESISTSILDSEEKIEDLQVELDQINKEIKTLEKQIKEKEEEYNEQEELLQERLIVQYKYGDTSYLDVLLNSKNIISFISNYYLVKEVLQYDQELLDSIEKQKKSIEDSKSELEDKQKSLKAKKAEQEVESVKLKNQKVEKQKYVENLNEEEKKLSEEIDKYNAAIKQLEAEARAASYASTGKFVGGVMQWPCPSSTRITSYFGGRSSPGGIGSTNHKGIDIGASSGSAITAALDGTVVKSGYNIARGNYIMIDHGGGIISLYQHGLNNSKKVSIGDRVTKGQTIMLVGSTGYSTGPHLHFEVIVNGTSVDPLTYLKG